MTYFAAGLARTGKRWEGRELDLDGVEDIDGVADELRDLQSDEGGLALLFLEENDEYFAVARLDDDGDPRVFISDLRAADGSHLASIVYDAAADAAVGDADEDETEDEDEEETTRPDAEPAGDPEILADLGTPRDVLLKLCASEGMLPGDVISALCERAGCLEVLEELRAG